MSCFSTGPRAGSYKPPRLGLFKPSRRTGFVICLTEIRRISSVVRTEKDTLLTVEGIGSEIFMVVASRIRRDDSLLVFSNESCSCRFPRSARRAGSSQDHVISASFVQRRRVQYNSQIIHPYVISSRGGRLIRLSHSPAVRGPCL